MNKIQLRAALELAEMDYEANQTPQNKARLEAALKAFEDFGKQEETPKQATEPAKAEPKAPKAEPKAKQEAKNTTSKAEPKATEAAVKAIEEPVLTGPEPEIPEEKKTE